MEGGERGHLLAGPSVTQLGLFGLPGVDATARAGGPEDSTPTDNTLSLVAHAIEGLRKATESGAADKRTRGTRSGISREDELDAYIARGA